MIIFQIVLNKRFAPIVRFTSMIFDNVINLIYWRITCLDTKMCKEWNVVSDQGVLNYSICCLRAIWKGVWFILWDMIECSISVSNASLWSKAFSDNSLTCWSAIIFVWILSWFGTFIYIFYVLSQSFSYLHLRFCLMNLSTYQILECTHIPDDLPHFRKGLFFYYSNGILVYFL